MASTERIFEILDTAPDIKDKPEASAMPSIKGYVDFKNVSFSYDGNAQVLQNVTFTVKPGEIIALVGPTGAGKTTIVNLISRFYETTEGNVKIDGIDVKDVTMTSLRGQMGIMMQDAFIFSGTIMDNIRYGRSDATEEEVIEAAKAVNAHEFITHMEKGYFTEVNERGSRLSTGQKQLISFARTLLKNPRILILDEATSSIDTHTEALIRKALETLLKDRTSFVIAHRLSTIRKADRIMVIDDGKIIQTGNHDELVHAPGIYQNLCKAQYRFLKAV
jgi:ATP-binding cassette subfamily B protein